MGLLRSEQMKHGTLVLPVDRARHFIDIIGSCTNMQFEDMNVRDMQRPYKKYIQRIDEMERILRFLMDELTRVPGVEVATSNIDNFLQHADTYKLDEVEAMLKQTHKDFIQFKDNNRQLLEKRNAALEERYVVQTAMAQMVNMPTRQAVVNDEDDFDFSASRLLLEENKSSARRGGIEAMFSNVAGVIPQAEQDRFARALFRATRGNTFTHFQQIHDPMQDPKTGNPVHKSVFVIYFQDHARSVASAMSEKINKICSSFGVNTYRWPSSPAAADEHFNHLRATVEDQQRLLKAHEDFVRMEAATLLEPPRRGANALIEDWRLFCMKEKSLYATLNLFEGHMNLRANCWYPAAEEDQIRAKLIQHSSRQQGHSSAMLVSDRTQPRKQPPTYTRKNEFTACIQDLIDIYGRPRYQEANPMIFNLVTFPFLFGIMYGDVGHGLLLLSVGLWSVWNADMLRENKTLNILFYGRYCITMMGFFGVYAGLMYNDFFSVGLTLFTSRWKAMEGEGQSTVEFTPDYDISNSGGLGPYPFGIDPAWHGSTNELTYLNSLKMKVSVIFGVTQMIAGLLLRFSNAMFERNSVDFVCECIPMMVFMVCFFGFMDLMIMYKWVTPMEDPPSIINSLICMGMGPLGQGEKNPMFGAALPSWLMMFSVLAVPCMLIPKPLILWKQHQAYLARSGQHGHGQHVPISDSENIAKTDEDAEAHFELGEILIHQIIETIEYVLGTISHTASYLRLWALSLAHQQLSLVFFQKILLSGMAMAFPGNVIAVYILFAVWFGITLLVLMGMDVMECFLHVLRLHWIEFQGKFFKADGYPFMPYRIRSVLEDEE
mmetsp:Transcript_34767/g.62660  ORF Transcript_34767/g.62660 Transcript_34767/m.62660 type:complete len:830 (+) Transcript_34767:176-2665(+)